MLKVFVPTIIVAIILTVLSPHIHAQENSTDSLWVNNEKLTSKLIEIDFSNTDGVGLRGCGLREVMFANSNSWSYLKTVCVLEGRHLSFAAFERPDGFFGFAVKGSDDVYRTIDDISSAYKAVAFMPESDSLLIIDRHSRLTQYDPKVYVYDNLQTKLVDSTYNLLTNQTSSYKLDVSQARPLLGYSSSEEDSILYPKISDYTISKNNRYLVANMEYHGYVNVELSSGSANLFANTAGSVNAQFSELPRLGIISDDGRYVFLENPEKVYDLKACGDVFGASPPERSGYQYKVNVPCGFRDISLEVFNQLGKYYYGVGHYFTNNNRTLIFTTDTSNESVKQAISISVFYSDAKLDYLALGDSYSSGEGDIGKLADGSSFYLPGTEQQKQCHISARSYPFLLADHAGIDQQRVRSVACSGARMTKDYYGDTTKYLGQGDKLKGKSDTELTSIRVNALSTFSPGVIKQIDFVRENKPKVITLTGGGNDVGFVNILKSCIYSYGLGNRTKTCDEAVAGTKKRAILGDAIRTQYENVVALINALKEASANTTIYIVGYPSFAAEGASTCINAANLNNDERKTINASVSYLNQVLASAAKSAGVHYINIENSLVGGRICEGSEYMTGFLNVLSQSEQLNNMFHPNSEGHAKMASAIIGSGFSVIENNNPAWIETATPVKPATFGSGTHVPTMQEKLLTLDTVVEAGKLLNFSTPLSIILRAGDKVSFTLYSTPTNLGTYTVPASGIVSAGVKLPKSIDPGLHMLVAEVQTQGNIVQRFYEYIEVGSGIVNDRDGDGIKDDKDMCTFLDAWYDEANKQNVCKSSVTNNNPSHGSGEAQHPPRIKLSIWKLLVHYWNVNNVYSGFMGVVICIGAWGLRYR